MQVDNEEYELIPPGSAKGGLSPLKLAQLSQARIKKEVLARLIILNKNCFCKKSLSRALESRRNRLKTPKATKTVNDFRVLEYSRPQHKRETSLQRVGRL